MMTLPEEFSKQISAFAPLFRKKVFQHAKVLLTGCLLVVGRRTVCSALRAVGLGHQKNFHKYHRVLNLSRWSCYKASRILLYQLVDHFFDRSSPLVFGIDETIERRWGPNIKARGIYRDAVRSSKNFFVKCSGLRWISLMLLTPISWADRVWALPFLTVLAPSERYQAQQGKRHKKVTDWARQMLLQLRRWLPDRRLVVVADASYAALGLLAAVQGHVCMIARLRMDAALYDFVPERPKGKRGPNRKKGERQPTLAQKLESPRTVWQEVHISNWYSRGGADMLVTTGTAIWYHGGKPPVKIRWVLLKGASGDIKPCALLCTDLNCSALEIVGFFVQRWNVEVTFQEARAHLGVETQRQWGDLAIARTTPVLMGLFSMVSLEPCAWYQKPCPTFPDAIACVRKRIWQNQKFLMSLFKGETHNSGTRALEHLILIAIRAA